MKVVSLLVHGGWAFKGISPLAFVVSQVDRSYQVMTSQLRDMSVHVRIG